MRGIRIGCALCGLAIALSLSGCAGPKRWSQVHGDMGNTGSQIAGPRTLDIVKALKFEVGDPGTASPVELPDGSILVTTAATPYKATKISRIRPDLQLVPRLFRRVEPVTHFFQRIGYLSTPAVDSAGNVYVTGTGGEVSVGGVFDGGVVRIFKLDPGGNYVWIRRLGRARKGMTSAVKLIEIGNKVSAFVQTYGDTGFELWAIDGEGNSHVLHTCSPSLVAGDGLAKPVPPDDPVAPYPEHPMLALAFDGNGTPHLLDPAGGCGIGFFRLASATTIPADWPSGLLFPSLIRVVEADSIVGTPSISAFTGHAVLRRGNAMEAYDFTTGTRIEDWSSAATALSPAPLMLNSAVTATNATVRLSPLDQPALPSSPWHVFGRIHAAAITPSSIYVLGDDGVYAFDASLNLQSFAPIPQGNGGRLAVTANGSLVVASRNGTTYVFLPN